MLIKNYAQKYENQVLDLWNKCCIFDAIDVQKFRKQALFDENFDVELAWIAVSEDDQVKGFIYGIKRKFPYLERGLEADRGWINVIFVDPEFRKRGIGQDLYVKVETLFKEKGVKNITLGAYSPNYFFWGLDPDHYSEAVKFFEKNGYYSVDMHYSMGKNLHGYQIPEITLKKKQDAQRKGYTFKTFDYADALEVLQFLHDEFGAGWKRNALISMREGTACDYQLVMRNPEGKVCGWCMRAIDGNPMRFGPIGIAKRERNNGFGSILLDMQCYEMAKKGIYRMYFITTEENGRRYYERNGLSVIRRFVDYRKDIA